MKEAIKRGRCGFLRMSLAIRTTHVKKRKQSHLGKKVNGSEVGESVLVLKHSQCNSGTITTTL